MINNTIRLLRKFQNVPSRQRPILHIWYKTFARLQLKFSPLVFDKTCNDSFFENIEKVWYKSYFITTEAIRGKAKEKIYQD